MTGDLLLLTRQILRERGDIPPDGHLENVTIDEFESKIRPQVHTA